MKMYVFSMRPYDELPCFEKYCPEYGVEYAYTAETPCMDNLGLAGGCEVINIITTLFTRPMLDRVKELGVKCIATRTIGYDHIDVEYAKKIGLGVVSVNYSPDSVAEYTVMLMIMGLRRMKHILERGAVQDYTLKGKIGKQLSDCTVGVIGTGRIGRAVIRDLQGFGCRILAYDIYENNEVRTMAEYTDLETLYRESDCITLHAPANEKNFHMIDRVAIAGMKDGAGIVNCARGALVDSDALIEGIEQGKIGFAALDVVEHEHGLYYFNRMGEPLNNPRLAILRSYSNVIISPHTAFYTERAVANMAENSIINAQKFLNGEESPFII